MAAVAASALLCFGLRVAPPDSLAALAVVIAGSASGAVAQRLRGGGGVVGGACGGAITSTGVGAVLCLWLYLNPQLKAWIAEPGKAFLFAALRGGLIGSLVGLLVRTWWRWRRVLGEMDATPER
jgi:hypothetical protein